MPLKNGGLSDFLFGIYLVLPKGCLWHSDLVLELADKWS